LKGKINELESNSTNKNIRELHRVINKFKKGYEPRTNLVKDEKGDLLADAHRFVNRWINYFCKLLNVQRWWVLGRQKCRQQSHLCQSIASLKLRLLLAIIGDHQCGFRRNRSKIGQIFYIRQILEKTVSIMVQYISYL
jgi:hypothetical protein